MNKRLGLVTVLALVTALPVAVAQQDKTFIGFWPFTEGTGTNAFDASGNNRTGVLTGWPLPVWTNGVRGGALIFDGLQNDVQVADAPGLTPENALTLAAWVQVATNTTSEVIAKWSTDIASGSYMLALTNGFPALELSLDGDYVCLIGQRGLPDSGWHHLAGTYDGQQMVVYLDGVAVGRQAATGTIAIVPVPLQLGLAAGQMQDVRLYDRALTDDEIAALAKTDSVAVKLAVAGVAPVDWQSIFLPATPNLSNWSIPDGLPEVYPPVPRRAFCRSGVVWYVDAKTGRNDHDGRAGELRAGHGPKQEIGATLQVAEHGDTIEIAAGRYQEKALASSGRTLILRPRGKVVLHGLSVNSNAVVPKGDADEKNKAGILGGDRSGWLEFVRQRADQLLPRGWQPDGQ